MLPSEAQEYLEIVRKRGTAKATLNRVYYNITKRKGLYLVAYANLYANTGALTPGIDPEDTIDGMSIERIETLMEQLKRKEYCWKPTRRTYISKKDGKHKRPLGMPGWNDKILQEVLRLVLQTYYEPQFRGCSHGFRPNRGCHTALYAIKRAWNGINWFIEGDIKGCFDHIRHEVILNILARQIKDTDFLTLIAGMLKAGYVEDWVYHQTYSGTPQGGVVSPLLMNVVLNEFDEYVEDVLIPQYTKGDKRQANREHLRLRQQACVERKKGNYLEAKRLHKRYSQLPSQWYEDPEYRRVKYLRYADDTLYGVIGTREDAEAIKHAAKTFLWDRLQLELSEEKTLITHATDKKARFLNYEIQVVKNDMQKAKVTVEGTRTKRRTQKGRIHLTVPTDVIQKWKAHVTKGGNARERAELIMQSDFDIITVYETQLQGLINYYSLADNVARVMYKLRYYFKVSLVKTLATKYKTTTAKIYRKYTKFTAEKKKVIAVEVRREGKKPLRAVFGAKPIHTKKSVVLNDRIPTTLMNRNELLTRLLGETCELCGKEGIPVKGHHIRKLKDLKKRYRGKKEPPEWVKKMIAIRRKTLFVCDACHQKIHAGTYDGRKLA